MFLESCGLLKKFAFQSMLLLVRMGKSEESTQAKELSPEREEKKKKTLSQSLVEKAKSRRVADFWVCLPTAGFV